MTTVADPIFIDANILIYDRVVRSPWNVQARGKLNALSAAGHPLWISRQTLREYIAGLSRPGATVPPIPMNTLLADVQMLQVLFGIVEDGPAVTAELITLLSSVSCGGKKIHDANIVATMRTHGIGKLLTHNVADFNRFTGWITIIPLVP